MFPGRIIKNVPGEPPKEKKEERLDDLTSLSRLVLLECLERQEKLLSNKSFVGKLPDKGSRILKLKNRLEEELNKRKNENISTVMAGLTISGKQVSEVLEWEGKCVPGTPKHKSLKQNISDEGEDNPFKILVSHSSSNSKKIYRVEDPPECLIKPSDLEGQNMTDDIYATHLCKKMDSVKPVKEKFLPYKTLKSKVEKKSTEGETRKSSLWDLSSATPPQAVHGDVKLVSLEDSIALQLEQAKHLKEVQLKHAVERLKVKSYYLGDTLPKGVSSSVYRETHDGSDDEHCEEHQTEKHEILD